MNPVVVQLPQPWIDRIDAIALHEERTRAQQVRWMLGRALDQLEASRESTPVADAQSRDA